MTKQMTHKHILLVDDDFEIIEVIKTYLEVSGFENIHEASDGERALEIICNNEIDLIISDVRMPGMNGVTLLENTLKLFPDKIIFLLVTDYAEVTPDKAYEKGAKEIMTKPLNLDKFIEKIQEYLQK